MATQLITLVDDRLAAPDVRLHIKRDDLVHAEVPGNKWRKLKYNLIAAKTQGHTRLLTFGGAYSNHIRATAAAGAQLGFTTIGIIRGEEHLPLNDTLSYASSRGMHLAYLDRTTYRDKTSPKVLDNLLAEFGPCYVLPEGGSNGLAVRGCAELPGEIDEPFDVICCACGTGGTLAGIAAGLRQTSQRALGFAVLKGAQFLDTEVRRHQADHGAVTENWSIEHDFHFGGYATHKPELHEFIADFESRHGIVLNWIYEAKMMYGLLARITQGKFPPGTTIIAVLS